MFIVLTPIQEHEKQISVRADAVMMTQEGSATRVIDSPITGKREETIKVTMVSINGVGVFAVKEAVDQIWAKVLEAR